MPGPPWRGRDKREGSSAGLLSDDMRTDAAWQVPSTLIRGKFLALARQGHDALQAPWPSSGHQICHPVIPFG